MVSQVHLEVRRPMRSGEYWQIALTASVSAMELAMQPEVEGQGMSFWARGSGRWDVLE